MGSATLEKNSKLSWAKAYESRMRKFNLKVILAALITLSWLSIVWWIFPK